jgi:hypothetical protein
MANDITALQTDKLDKTAQAADSAKFAGKLPADFVDRTTNQSIAGNKTFTGSTVLGNTTLGASTFNANASMGNNKITNLATPTANGDAVTKQYVDSQVISSATDLGRFAIYQSLYAGCKSWVGTSDTLAAKQPLLRVKKISISSIRVRIENPIANICPYEMTPSMYLNISTNFTQLNAVVPGAGTQTARTCDADGLLVNSNDILLYRQDPAKTNTDVTGTTLMWSLYNGLPTAASGQRQPWDYHIATYDGGVFRWDQFIVDTAGMTNNQVCTFYTDYSKTIA